MGIIELIDRWAEVDPDRIAHECGDERLTYAQLRDRSDSLACHLSVILRGLPIVVYGHKSPLMLVAFLSAVKSGHPYIPVDSSWPAERIAAVVEESGAPLIIATESLPQRANPGHTRVLTADRLDLVGASEPGRARGIPVAQDEPFYIIYTSGSTGRPKGVQISRGALESFVAWIPTFTAVPAMATAREGAVWLNQAPFSFDLSVMDVYGSLTSGGTLHSVTSALVARPRDLQADLRDSGISVWISTPSFADLCLADPAFTGALLPRAAVFWFCGETLSPATAGALLDRFPGAVVYNTYGPTEATVAVTSIRVDQELIAHGGALPVGKAKPGTTLLIDTQVASVDGSNGGTVPTLDADHGSAGEVVIAGDTVSLGYRGRPELTARAFFCTDVDGVSTPAYRTGDLGRLDAEGRLHFLGRIDNQIKLHGYRIEIEDIESNLRRLDDIVHAAVVPVGKDGTITHLKAFVQLQASTALSPLAYATDVKRRLKAYLPDYMVPKVIQVIDQLPLTSNGKVDRRRLGAG